MPKGLRLTQRHRARLARLQRRPYAMTLREIARLLGYDPRTNWSIVQRALDPDHSFQRDVLVDLERRIDELPDQLNRLEVA
jgi:hypothetical protein